MKILLIHGASFRQLIERTNDTLRTPKYDQIAQLVGPAVVLGKRILGITKEFLRVERIHGRRIRLETIDYSHAPFKIYSFWVSVDTHGAIALVP